jgi:predicted nucleic acid-binding protein
VVEQYKKPYFDANILLAWIKKEPNRHENVAHILTLAEKGQFHIFTSTITLAEVHKLRGGTILPDELNGKLLQYFEHEFIELIDVDRVIGEQANAFCRQYGIMPNCKLPATVDSQKENVLAE